MILDLYSTRANKAQQEAEMRVSRLGGKPPKRIHPVSAGTTASIISAVVVNCHTVIIYISPVGIQQPRPCRNVDAHRALKPF